MQLKVILKKVLTRRILSQKSLKCRHRSPQLHINANKTELEVWQITL
uniref:Uncharacterized protein n=1 Tax=Anguilla anguilla TaxID=7936 RepID=A0A0E9VKU7_ANGAN